MSAQRMGVHLEPGADARYRRPGRR
jgi:hypothetical protein